MRWFIHRFPFAVIGGFVGYSIYRDEVARPIARLKVDEVRKQFLQLPVLSGAVAASDGGVTFDPQHVTRGRLYSSEASYGQIRAHYDFELSKLGWKLDREVSVDGVDGKYHGGKQVSYSKGDLTAFLHYKGPGNEYGYTYYFCVYWDY